MTSKQNRVLINLSNIHAGGALQVAISFVSEIIKLKKSDSLFVKVLVSSKISEAFDEDVLSASEWNFHIFDTFGLKALFSSLNTIQRKYHVVFTLFGPKYTFFKSHRDIQGFAQLWILQPKNPISQNMPFIKRQLMRLKFQVQWLFFLRADHYIVELEHVRDGLVLSKYVEYKNISVVYNTISSLYLSKSEWKKIYFEKNNEDISLGIVARDYPHKNLSILPFVAQKIEVMYDMKVHFYTTLNSEEWALRDAEFKKYVSTVGSLNPNECPSFYEQVDGVIFPSLLECFSATPLEAMVMGKPLFASDKDFVKNVCFENATYFNPLDSNDIAHKIVNYYKLNPSSSKGLDKARMHALNFSSARNRAEKFLEIIHQYSKD